MVESGIIFGVVALLLPLGMVYIFKRNKEVYNFRIKLCDLCYDWNMSHIEEICNNPKESSYVWLYEELPTYETMLYSFKPLKMKYWVDNSKLQKLFN